MQCWLRNVAHTCTCALACTHVGKVGEGVRRQGGGGRGSREAEKHLRLGGGNMPQLLHCLQSDARRRRPPPPAAFGVQHPQPPRVHMQHRHAARCTARIPPTCHRYLSCQTVEAPRSSHPAHFKCTCKRNAALANLAARHPAGVHAWAGSGGSRG